MKSATLAYRRPSVPKPSRTVPSSPPSPPKRKRGAPAPPLWEGRFCELEMRLTQLAAENQKLRAAYAQLEAADASHAKLHDFAPFGFLTLDTQGTILDLNRAAAALLGREKSHLLGRPFAFIVAPEDLPRFLAQLRSCRHSHKIVSSEFSLRGARVEAVLAQFAIALVPDGHARAARFEATLIDITERRRAEAALRASEQSLRALIEASPHPIQFKNADGHWLLANPAALELFELTGVDYRGKRDAELTAFAPFYRRVLGQSEQTDRAVLESGRARRGDEVIPRPDGSARTFDIIRVPLPAADGQPKGIVTVGYDITERLQSAEALRQAYDELELRVQERTAELRQANAVLQEQIAERRRVEEALRKSEERFRFALKNSPVTVFSQDRDLRYLWIHNPQLGLTEEQIIGRTDAELFSADGAAHLTRVKRQVLERGVGARAEVSFTHDGEACYLDLTLEPFRDARRSVAGIICTATDITERKQAERVRARLAAIVESSADAITSMSLEGIITSWNQAAERMYGYSSQEIMGRALSVLVSPERREELEEIMEQIKRGEIVDSIETLRVCKDGRRLPVALTISPIRDAGGNIAGASGIARDISERRRLEAEILRVSEHEQRRIAQDLHDGLGQELAGIACLSDALKRNLGAQASPEAAGAAKICRLLNAAVTQTRSLARGLYPVEAESHGLMSALQHLASRAQDLFKVRCSFECPRPVLLGDNATATHLYRIAQEAVTNAIKHGRSSRVEIRLSSTPRRLTLAVRDNGIGIRNNGPPREGLGLRMMEHRAEMIHGALVVQNETGGGTDVVCSLKWSEQPSASEQVYGKANDSAHPIGAAKTLHRR